MHTVCLTPLIPPNFINICLSNESKLKLCVTSLHLPVLSLFQHPPVACVGVSSQPFKNHTAFIMASANNSVRPYAISLWLPSGNSKAFLQTCYMSYLPPPQSTIWTQTLISKWIPAGMQTKYKSKPFYYLCLKWPPVDKLQPYASNMKTELSRLGTSLQILLQHTHWCGMVWHR